MKFQRPNNIAFKRYLSARKDFKQGHYKLATNKLLSLDTINENDDVNHLLVKCLYYQKDYRDAEQILLADVNSYTTQKSLTTLMLKVLLKNHEFIICREIVMSFNSHQLKDYYLQRIEDYETNLMQVKPDVIDNNAKAFYHLSSGSLIRQRIVFKRAQRLPFNIFYKIAKSLLVDPFLAPIMRLSILDTLRKSGVHSKLEYRWIDNRSYLINVGKLRGLTETSSYRQIMWIIRSKYYHNPTRMLALKQNLRLDLSYLYPFNDRKIIEPELWVKIAALRIKGEQPEFKNQKIKSIYYLQVKLNQFTKNLTK